MDTTTPEPFDDPAFDKETVVNDAVAGETVIDNGHYAGPEGSEPLEAEPRYDDNDLDDENIDLGAASEQSEGNPS